MQGQEKGTIGSSSYSSNMLQVVQQALAVVVVVAVRLLDYFCRVWSRLPTGRFIDDDQMVAVKHNRRRRNTTSIVVATLHR